MPVKDAKRQRFRLVEGAASRVPAVGLAAVLLFLTGFAMWAALTTNAAADKAERATALADAYQRARYAVAAEESLERKYRLEPGPEVRELFEQAALSLQESLQEAGRHGAEGDQKLVGQLLARHDRYRESIHRMFDAVDAGQAKLVLAIDEHATEPIFSLIEERVDAAATRHRALAFGALRSLTSAESVVLAGTPAAFAVGIVLLVVFSRMLLGYRRRIEEAREAEITRFKQEALTDSLTQLNNHRAFQEDLGRELERQSRTGAPLSLVMLDLDRLKRINDSLGHQAGDEMLKRLASCLTETMRGSDAAYRFGGDEFAVILVGDRAVGAFMFVQRVQAALADEKAPTPVTVTAGIAEAVARTTKEALIRLADLALLEAKRTNRGALIYSPDLEIGVALADQAVEQHHRKTLASALARAVDAKDSYTRSHCETVSELCVRIAEALGLEPERIQKLRLAGLLHDVGKIGITDAILQKPSKLTDEEFTVMRTHPTLGYDIVHAAEMEEEARWIRHHHERIDGHGYPDGLSGDEIPIESRTILVADAFEAITSDRPYRKGQSEGTAFAELERHAGTQFDPDCVAALKRALVHGTRPSDAFVGLVSV